MTKTLPAPLVDLTARSMVFYLLTCVCFTPYYPNLEAALATFDPTSDDRRVDSNIFFSTKFRPRSRTPKQLVLFLTQSAAGSSGPGDRPNLISRIEDVRLELH